MAKFLAVLESTDRYDTGQMIMIAVSILEIGERLCFLFGSLLLNKKHRSGKSDLDYTSAASVIFGAKGRAIGEQKWRFRLATIELYFL